MSSMADIVVKKNDTTTDITWTALTASAGDGVAAQWRSESVATQVNAKPQLNMVTKFNGPKTARRVEITLRYPQSATDTTTSLVSVVNNVIGNFSMVLPAGTPDTVINEAVSQFTNLLKSSLILGSIKAGYAPV